MTEYIVQWTIDTEADSPREAAELASCIMHDDASIANVLLLSTLRLLSQLKLICGANKWREIISNDT